MNIFTENIFLLFGRIPIPEKKDDWELVDDADFVFDYSPSQRPIYLGEQQAKFMEQQIKERKEHYSFLRVLLILWLLLIRVSLE